MGAWRSGWGRTPKGEADWMGRVLSTFRMFGPRSDRANDARHLGDLMDMLRTTSILPTYTQSSADDGMTKYLSRPIVTHAFKLKCPNYGE